MADAEKRYNVAFLQYVNSTQIQTTSTTFLNFSLAGNQNSLPEGKLTKVNATDFRADFNGYVRVRFDGWGYTGDNDRGYEVAISKNGTTEPGTAKRATSKNVVERANSVSAMKIIPVVSGDIIRFQYRSIEGSVLTFDINTVEALVELYAED